MALKPLNQNDFGMKIVQDLGMCKTLNANRAYRLAIFECSTCNKDQKLNVAHMKKTQRVNCKLCTDTNNTARSHRLYMTWANCKQRCYNVKHPSYHVWGGRGISLDKRFHKFTNWLDYVSMLPNYGKKGYSLDRVCNDFNYEPMNLRWVDRSTQTQNVQVLRSNNTSGYKGAVYDKYNKKWMAQIMVNNKQKGLGSYKTVLQAAKAYDSYIVIHTLQHTRNNLKVYNDIHL